MVCELWAAIGSSWWNADYVTTEGTEFWVTFMRNRGSDENDTDLELYLFATSRSNATVTISNPNTSYKDTFTVKAGQRSTRIKIDNLQAYIATPAQPENKGLKVTSDYPISLYAINYVQGSQDATYLYPTKGYSNNDSIHSFTGFSNKQYVIQTFNTDETATEFAIVATEDNTKVDITLKESIFSGDDDYPELPYSDTIINISTIASFTLNKGQTYLYRASTANASLSGTSICSDKNIVVFQGGQHSLIPSYYYTPDNHIWAQALPTNLWGRKFVITQSGTQKADGVLITAAEDDTNLSIDTIGGVIDTTINKSQTFDFYMRGKSYSVVLASKPVECFLYQTSFTYPETQTYGSPAMIPIMPIENRFNSIIYATFEFHNPQIKPEDQKHYINIVTLTSGVSSMMMQSSKNGSSLGTPQSLSNNFNKIAGTEYSYAIIDVSDRGESHVLFNEKEGFVAHAYGFGTTKGSYKESYGYSLGTNLIPSAWMLIDGQRVNEKQICLNKTVNFEPVVNFDYTEPVQWEVHHRYNHELVDNKNQQDVTNYAFPDSGHYDIYMIVNRQAPICDNTISDTVIASIIVKDTFHIQPSLEEGNYRIICAKDRSDVLVSGETYQYRSDTMEINQTYSYVDSLQTTAGCDSIVYIKVFVAPEYEHQMYDTICVNDLPYLWIDQSDVTVKTLDLNPSDKESLYLTSESTFLTKQINDIDTFKTIYGCDSIVNICLTVLPIYHNAVKYDAICESALPYNYEDTRAMRLQNLTSSGLYTDTIPSVTGCDSIIELQLKVWQATMNEHDVLWCYKAGAYEYGDHGKTATASGTYIDTLATKNTHGCDSIEIVHLTISETIVDVEYDTICGDTYFNHHDVRATKLQGLNVTGIYRDTLQSVTDCDSVIELHLQVGETYAVDYRDTICDNEELEYEGTIYKNLTAQDEPYQYDVMLHSMYGCDSLVHFYLKVYPTYSFSQDTIVCQDRDNTNWEWTDDFGGLHVLDDPISIANVGTIHLVDNLSTQYGCDSTFTINITIVPSYYFFDTLTICDDDTVHWQDSVIAGSKYNGDYALNIRDKQPAGVYDYSIHYETAIYHCDSTYALHLKINPAYPEVAATDTTVRHICDNEIYHFKTATQDTIYNQTIRDWAVDDKSIGRHVLTGMDTTIHGCDSVVAHVVYVHPAYEYWQDTTVCQDTVNTAWIWTDEFGNSHADRVPISLYHAGDFVYSDTLKRSTCTDCGNPNGCDSVFTIQIHILPAYRFDSTYIICQTEHITWQGRRYAGDSADIEVGEKMLAVGVYYDTAYYTTLEGCDSIYYLQLTVAPQYDTLTYVDICDNEDFVWRQSDSYGTYADVVWAHHMDTVWLGVSEASLQQPMKPVTNLYRERMLRTIHNCDSLSKLHLSVRPSYFFVTDTSLCSSDWLFWRGKKYLANDTIIEERYSTVLGCDSIYQLRLHMTPSYFFRMYRQICDNETLYHINNNYIIWQPGQDIPEPEDCNGLLYHTHQGCDSFYCYYITVHPTYFFEDTIDLCSGDQYIFRETRAFTYDHIYDTGTWIPAIDTLIADTFSTIYGCDSIYCLHATIYPTYKHVDYATICDNECFTWRDRTYCGLNATEGEAYGAGEYVFYDSLFTEHGCDSIYALELTIHPTYFYESHEAICDNDVYNFHGRILSGVAGEYLYTDSLHSIYGCDSVHHLYLTIKPTKSEVVYDTLCVDEVYNFNDKPLTQSGYYIDTIINDLGCQQVTELYLTVEDPTSVQLDYVSEFCDNEKVLEIHYSYGGRMPISYSVLFDEFGHSQGFTDIVKEPVKEDGVLFINIPYGDPLPKPIYNPLFLETDIDTYRYIDTTHLDYPRPGKYNISVFLQNGVCADDRIRVDTVFEMLFPSWIHEQHWNDAIVLFNENYNGGYVFDSYEWYCDGEHIPGEVQGYLYDPQLLKFGSEYCVKLTYSSIKGVSIIDSAFTCPITPIMMVDTIAPVKPYVAVVPTCLPIGLSGVDILCTEEGIHSYAVYTSEGLPIITKGNFKVDSEHQVHHVPISQIPGLYVVSVITQSGYRRSVKVKRDCDLK